MYRTINDSLWGEPWFEDLSVHAKLLFLNLLSNRRQTPCGVVEISLRSLTHETGLTEDQWRGAMEELEGIQKAEWWPDLNCVWLVRFYRWQRSNSSDNYTKAAVKHLQTLPQPIQARVVAEYKELGEGWYTHPQPMPIPSLSQGDKEEEEETATAKEEEGRDARARAAPAAPAQPPRYSPAFETFWLAYPAKGRDGKPATWQVWQALRPDGETADAILAGVERWKKGRRWQEGIVVSAKRWLKERRWEDEVEPASAARASPGRQRPQLDSFAAAAQIDAVLNGNGAMTYDDGSIEGRVRHSTRLLAEPDRGPGRPHADDGSLRRGAG